MECEDNDIDVTDVEITVNFDQFILLRKRADVIKSTWQSFKNATR